MQSEEWIYGVNPVLEALRAGRNMKTVYVASGRHERAGEVRQEAEKRRVPVKTAEMAFFERRFPKGHQGVAAVVMPKGLMGSGDLLSIPAGKDEPALFVILDGVEDPRNFGAILRSSDAAGVHGVVIQSHRSAGLGSEAAKTSAGAVEHVPVSVVANIKHAMRDMKEQGIAVIGADMGDYPAFWDLDLTGPLALVIGSEGKGLRRTVKEQCDLIATIPMRGKINSLNASVAAAIALFEVLRQRSAKSKKF